MSASLRVASLALALLAMGVAAAAQTAPGSGQSTASERADPAKPAPPPQPAPAAERAALPPAVWAPAPHAALKKIVFAAAAGSTAGALIGTRGLSFANFAGSDRTAHEWRAGLTYGVIGGVLSAAIATRVFRGSEPDAPHRFWLDRWNTPLLAGIVAVQALDYSSTRYFRDRNKDEWLLTNGVVDHRAAFVGTEAAAAAAAIGLVWLFHRTGHHRLERWVAAGYIAAGATSAIANYRYPSTGHDLFGH